MKKLRYLLVWTMMLTMTSCAELFETFISGEQIISALNSVRLSHKRVDLMAGDTIVFELEIDPDTFNMVQPTCRWSLSNPETEAVSMIGRRLFAKKEGEVDVYLAATPPGLSPDDVPEDSIMRDTCMVTVAERFEVSYEEYPYETIVIGQLQIDDEVVTDSATISLLTAVIGQEVRGRGIPRRAFGIPYVELVIYGREYGEEGIIELYDKENLQRSIFTDFVMDGNTHGTISDPIVFRIESPVKTNRIFTTQR